MVSWLLAPQSQRLAPLPPPPVLLTPEDLSTKEMIQQHHLAVNTFSSPFPPSLLPLSVFIVLSLHTFIQQIRHCSLSVSSSLFSLPSAFLSPLLSFQSRPTRPSKPFSSCLIFFFEASFLFHPRSFPSFILCSVVFLAFHVSPFFLKTFYFLYIIYLFLSNLHPSPFLSILCPLNHFSFLFNFPSFTCCPLLSF